MTDVYFVRHAQSDSGVHDDRSRPLTEKGLRDRALVSGYLMDKGIRCVASSPYRRAVDTVAPFAERAGLAILEIEDFRERRVTDEWIEDFSGYAKRQWADFDYKLPGGESLREVQSRNVRALHRLIADHPDEAIAVGSHGTALSTVIHRYDPSFDYARFREIVDLMPWIVHFRFDGERCVIIEPVELFG